MPGGDTGPLSKDSPSRPPFGCGLALLTCACSAARGTRPQPNIPVSKNDPFYESEMASVLPKAAPGWEVKRVSDGSNGNELERKRPAPTDSQRTRPPLGLRPLARRSWSLGRGVGGCSGCLAGERQGDAVPVGGGGRAVSLLRVPAPALCSCPRARPALATPCLRGGGGRASRASDRGITWGGAPARGPGAKGSPSHAGPHAARGFTFTPAGTSNPYVRKNNRFLFLLVLRGASSASGGLGSVADWWSWTLTTLLDGLHGGGAPPARPPGTQVGSACSRGRRGGRGTDSRGCQTLSVQYRVPSGLGWLFCFFVFVFLVFLERSIYLL